MYSSKGFPLDDSSAPCGNGFVVASVSQPALNTKSRGEGFTYFEGSTITVAPNVEVPRIDALPYQTWVSAENAPPAKKSRLDDAMPAGVCPVPEGDFSTLNSPARTDTSRGTPSIDVHAVPGTPLSIQTIVEVPPQSFQSSFEGIHKERCEVCGDEPSGNHYGALCCDGCKGFFKRSTVSGQTYHCRFRNACDIGATNRNSCRACRFKKCLKVGMRIQKSKDIDDIRRWFAPDQQLDGNLLMEARRVFLGADRIALFQPAYEVGKSYREVSSVHEVRDAYLALHDSFTRWARGTPMLWRLSLSDSVALAEAGAAERFILDILHRSQGKNYYDLGSNFLFTKLGIVPAHNDTVAIFFASFASTMGLINDLKATDREFSYLRALSYFNQPLENDQSRETVKNLRNHFLRGLESEQAGLKRGSDRFVKLSVILRRTVTLSRRLSDLLSRAVLTEVATCQ